jgi:AcrR family transcriptional regulator
MSRFTWTPELSDTARQMRDTGASLRDIAAAVGAGKDAVRRHLATLSQADDQQQATVSPSLGELVARRQSHALAAMEQLGNAVARVVADRVSHLILGETRARQVEAELRHRAAELVALADAFRELYPDPPSAPTTHTAGHDRNVASH